MRGAGKELGGPGVSVSKEKERVEDINAVFAEKMSEFNESRHIKMTLVLEDAEFGAGGPDHIAVWSHPFRKGIDGTLKTPPIQPANELIELALRPALRELTDHVTDPYSLGLHEIPRDWKIPVMEKGLLPASSSS
jgi:hypothetical protein